MHEDFYKQPEPIRKKMQVKALVSNCAEGGWLPTQWNRIYVTQGHNVHTLNR